MKKALLLSILICAVLLTGCNIKLPFLQKESHKEDEDNTNSITNQLIKEVENTKESLDDFFDESFVIAIDEAPENGSEEILDSFIDFDADGSFNAYLGFGNTIFGSYTIKNNIITCNATTYANDYSPVQEISASFTLKKDNAILKVISSSSTYRVKTTNMNENGDWVFDGEEKDLYLTSFTPGYTYTLYMPIDY